MCTVKLNPQQTRWARRYGAALAGHLTRDPEPSLRAALKLGHQAAALNLETLDLAKIHEQSLPAMAPAKESTQRRIQRARRAKRFFEEAIVPIETTHAAALHSKRRVLQVTKTLHERTSASVASRAKLAKSKVHRQVAEAALKKSDQHLGRLLTESKRMQTILREKTRATYAADERRRKMSSLRLQNEISQTLLGINIRLLALNTLALSSTHNLKNEIARTRDLVKKSKLTITRLAREMDVDYET